MRFLSWHWLTQPLQQLLSKHGFLFLLWLRRDFKSRYAGSIAGLLWALLQPLFTIAIFYVVFALVLKVRIPEFANQAGYFFYLLAGLLPWLSIADGIARASGSLVAQEQFLQRIVFPIDILPITVIVSSLAAQLIGTIIYVLLLWSAGVLEPWRLFFWPLVLLAQLGMCLGIGCLLAIISIYVRDVVQIVPVVLQLLFYAAPILYPKSIIPERYHSLFWLNPVTGLIEAYQAVFLGFSMSMASLVALGLWVLLLGGGGWLLFRALKPTLGDHL